MTYDLADRLTKIDPTGTTNDATFSLDALGRFKTRVLSGSTDTYSYLGTAETVLRISNSSGPTLTDSLVSPSGDRLGVRQGATLNWLTPDLHGNVAGALDATEATVVNAIRYDAFGETLQTGSAGGTAVGAANWKFQGRLDVSPAGLAAPLYDMSARFYAPGIGAFTQLDSVMGSAQNPLSMNRFLYALANPAAMIDPDGHMACGGYAAFDGMQCQKRSTAGLNNNTGKATKPWSVKRSRHDSSRSTKWRINARSADSRNRNTPSMSEPRRCEVWALQCHVTTVGAGFAIRTGEAVVGTGELAADAMIPCQSDGTFCQSDALAQAGKDTATRAFTDRRGPQRDIALGAAGWIGETREGLLSGDPQRTADAAIFDVVMLAALVAPGPKAAPGIAEAAGTVRTGELYINGGMTANNLTPRVGDLDGLSAWDSAAAGVRGPKVSAFQPAVYQRGDFKPCGSVRQVM